MSMLFWNVRGINKSPRLRDYLSLTATHKPSVVCIVETKVKEAHSSRISDYIPSDWNFLNNYSSDNSGRIWILWDTKAWNCTHVDSSAQYITISALNIGGFSCYITCIYAFNFASFR